jgi:transcription initiation factor TFIIH subunit 3
MAAGPETASGAQREANLLVTVVEVSDAFSQSLQFENPAQQLTVSQCLDNVTTFLNSYLLLQQTNSVAVCLCYPGGSRMVYPVAGKEEASLQDPEQMSSGKYEPLVHMNALLGEEIRKTMAEIAGQQVHGASSLPTALSKCLCYIQRCFRETSLGTKLNARILVIMSSVDTASQYVPTMNCIFAAQKHKILIDSCVLWQDSGFLQQVYDHAICYMLHWLKSVCHYLLFPSPSLYQRHQISQVVFI